MTRIGDLGCQTGKSLNATDIVHFNQVAERSSFTRAAVALGVTASAVSKRVSRLEATIGVSLLYRSSRCVRLTDAGRKLFHHTGPVTDILNSTLAIIRKSQIAPCGSLAVTMPTSIGASIIPVLTRVFGEEWPEVSLRLSMDDRCKDLIADGYDLAIRVATDLRDSNLVARHLASTPEVIVGSPGYFHKHGKPKTPSDLESHRGVLLAGQSNRWHFNHSGNEITASVGHVSTVDSELAVILMAVLDGGIARIPRLLIDSELRRGRLVRVLFSYGFECDYNIYAIYPTRHPPAAVLELTNLMRTWIPKLGQLDRWNPLEFSVDAE